MISPLDKKSMAATRTSNKHQVRDKFKEILINELKLPEIDATDLEIGVFNSTIDYANSLRIQLSWSCQLFMETYINNARSIYSNLKEDSYIGNTQLMQRLQNREFTPHELSYMSTEEVFPERWKDIVDKQKLKLKTAYEVKQVSMTDSIKCGKCKNNKISYYELQIRSGDENMTQFFCCISCGHKWKS
jgi:DNA-directed RNA polymerase subunit M/transcription elongation factor TFIIS